MSEVSFTRRGVGEPIVLVHGLGSRRQVFDPVLDALAEDHDVVALDLPGFGSTPLPAGFTPSPAAYAEWLAGWLGDIGVEQPHVVGNSMGGGIALEMGRRGTASRVSAFSPIGFWRAPGRVWCQHLLTTLRAVGTVGGEGLGRTLEAAPARAAAAGLMWGRPTRLSPDTLRDDIAALVQAPGFPAARDSFTGYAFDGAEELDGVPVTVAWGTRDVLLTHRTQSRRARAALPRAQHLDLRGCGHIPFHDDPDLCVSVILKDPS